jgi:hypothetical protein
MHANRLPMHSKSLLSLTALSVVLTAALQPERALLAQSADFSRAQPSSAGSYQFNPLPDAPPNDFFASRTILTGHSAVLTATNTLATCEEGEPSHGTHTLWWSWTAPGPGVLTLAASAASFPPVLRVYRGNSLDKLHWPYDYTPWQSSGPFRIVVVEDEVLQIAVAKPGADWPPYSSGAFTLSMQFDSHGAPPANDEFASAVVLNSADQTVSGSTIGATRQAGEPYHGDFTAWYSWVAPADGSLIVGIPVADFDPLLCVYRGETIEELFPALEAEGIPKGQFGLLPVRQGEPLSIAVAGTNSRFQIMPFGNFDLAVEFLVNTAPPPHDDFSARKQLSVSGEPELCSLVGASREPGEPVHANSPTGTIWWTFTAPTEGTLFLNCKGRTFNPRLAIYGGAVLSQLQLFGLWNQVPNQIILPSVDLAQGQRVEIVVASQDHRVGPFTIESFFKHRPPGDDFAQSIKIEGDSAILTAYCRHATCEANEPDCEEVGSVWWSYVAPQTSRVTLTRLYIPASGNWISLYTGPSLDRLKPVLVDDRFGGITRFTALSNAVYHIRIQGWEWAAYQLEAELLPTATNDNFADAFDLTESPITGPWSNLGATREPGEPAHLLGGPNKSLWWRWQAPCSGGIGLSTDGSTVTTPLIAVYQGDSVDNLWLVTKGKNYASFEARGGELYYFAIETPVDVNGDIVLLGMPGSPSFPQPIPGNIILNPSFEFQPFTMHWAVEDINAGYGGTVGGHGAAHGRNWISLPAAQSLFQDLPTEAGRRYGIRVATLAEVPNHRTWVRVWFDNKIVGELDYLAGHPPFWRWGVFTALASSTTSRLKIENLHNYTSIDAVSVVWLQEPPSIVAMPESRSALEGSTVTFFAAVRGTEPLTYEWYFEDAIFAGATGRSLTLDSISQAHAGAYRIVVKNPFGSATSIPATLTVESAKTPVIVLQPSGDTLPQGTFHVLSAAAVGTPTLTYQWQRDGVDIPGAVNPRLVFESLQPNDAGMYTVSIRNSAGAVLSLPARLALSATSEGGGVVRVQNWQPAQLVPEIFAPIFDSDGVTKLSGADYLAQLYAGPPQGQLRPCGQPMAFLTGHGAGFFWPSDIVLPHIPPEQPAVVQLRVWQASRGASYEEARALGGKFARSETLEVITGSNSFSAALLIGLSSFSLQAGMPAFATGRLELSHFTDDGAVVWRLHGAPGFQYLIEQSDDDFNWRPLLVLRNETGTVEFNDPTPDATSNRFYRSRILD